jgi:hypothetical protein
MKPIPHLRGVTRIHLPDGVVPVELRECRGLVFVRTEAHGVFVIGPKGGEALPLEDVLAAWHPVGVDPPA